MKYKGNPQHEHYRWYVMNMSNQTHHSSPIKRSSKLNHKLVTEHIHIYVSTGQSEHENGSKNKSVRAAIWGQHRVQSISPASKCTPYQFAHDCT